MLPRRLKPSNLFCSKSSFARVSTIYCVLAKVLRSEIDYIPLSSLARAQECRILQLFSSSAVGSESVKIGHFKLVGYSSFPPAMLSIEALKAH